MQKLILVRHSESKLDVAFPPQKWVLTPTGRSRCLKLAARLAVHQPAVIVTSDEVKAVQTGEIAARTLKLPCHTALGLEEHHRKGGEIAKKDQWQTMIKGLFEQPDEVVFGLETANQARKRFSAAVWAVMAEYPGRNVALVSHGTVMSLYFQELTAKDPFNFWQKLGLPAFYVVSWPGREVLLSEMVIE